MVLTWMQAVVATVNDESKTSLMFMAHPELNCGTAENPLSAPVSATVTPCRWRDQRARNTVGCHSEVTCVVSSSGITSLRESYVFFAFAQTVRLLTESDGT